jgi:hypothetical protein
VRINKRGFILVTANINNNNTMTISPYVMPFLQLSLKSNWFFLTKTGLKTEDYREINPYWCSRLLLSFNGEKMTQNLWKHKFEELQVAESGIKENIELFTNFRKFSHNVMTLGYPRSTDFERIIKFEHKGIEVRIGRQNGELN